MPIYAYRCDACGHAKDVLQKLSDPVLSTCPACGAEAFRKQLTAAGFQLKGSGWYVTDFKSGNNGAAAKPADAKPAEGQPAETSKPADAPAAASGSDGGSTTASATPAAGCGGGCACH